MNVIERFSDALLSRLVPNVEASAGTCRWHYGWTSLNPYICGNGWAYCRQLWCWSQSANGYRRSSRWYFVSC